MNLNFYAYSYFKEKQLWIKKENIECFLPKKQIKILSGLSLGFRCFFLERSKE